MNVNNIIKNSLCIQKFRIISTIIKLNLFLFLKRFLNFYIINFLFIRIYASWLFNNIFTLYFIFNWIILLWLQLLFLFHFYFFQVIIRCLTLLIHHSLLKTFWNKPLLNFMIFKIARIVQCWVSLIVFWK